MILKELLGKIGFEVDKSKLDGVESQLEGIKHLMEAFGAAEVLKGVFEMTRKFGEFAESIHLAATAAGVTVEAFQKLSYAAQQNGVSSEEMSGALARISRHLYDARMGSSEAQQVFMQAGFTGDQIRGFKNSTQVMAALSDQFTRIQDPMKKQAILMQLAGRGSYNMVGFLSQGSAALGELGKRADELGIVLGHENVEALVEAKHALDTLFSVFKSLGAYIASYFAPSVKSAVNEFLEFYKANRQLLDLEVKKWIYDITYAMGVVWAIVKFVAQSILDFAKNHEVLVRRVGEAILILGALASVIFVVKTAFSVVGIVLSSLMSAFRIFGVIVAVVESPLFLVAAAIGAVIVAGQALWKLFHGGSLKDTWIGEFISWVGKFEIVSKSLAFMKGLFAKAGEGIANAASGVAGMFEGGSNLQPGLLSAVTNISSVPNISAVPSGPTIGAAGNNSYEINAPVTITVPQGTDPQTTQKTVKDGIKEHLDRLHRETQRSLTPVQAY